MFEDSGKKKKKNSCKTFKDKQLFSCHSKSSNKGTYESMTDEIEEMYKTDKAAPKSLERAQVQDVTFSNNIHFIEQYQQTAADYHPSALQNILIYTH